MSSPRVTSRPLATEGQSAGGTEFDDLDDLFDYDARDENDPFSDNYKPPSRNNTVKQSTKNAGNSGAGLGIDEEVEVTKKARAPRVKLDEHKLLSAAGIPKLRQRAKDHLKLKGKGHEYSDAAKLLAFYQLWLDDLFPKARFLDALAMVEKTGHKKQMQSIRMEWINAGKPKSSVRESSVFDEPYLARREDDEREKTAPRVAPIFEKSASERPKTPVLDADGEMEMGDLYDATPKAPRQRHSQGEAESQDSLFGRGTTLSRPVTEVAVPDAPQEDELDALLAEDDTVQTEVAETKLARTASKARAPQDDQFNDDMEAMAEMDDLWG